MELSLPELNIAHATCHEGQDLKPENVIFIPGELLIMFQYIVLWKIHFKFSDVHDGPCTFLTTISKSTEHFCGP